MSKQTAIHVMPDNSGGYIVFAIGSEAYAQLKAGKSIEEITTTGFQVLRHDETSVITNLVINMVDGDVSTIHTVQE